MRFDLLTNEQLYAIAGNKAHRRFLRNGADAELQRRGLIGTEAVSLSVIYRQEIKHLDKPLPVAIKIALLFVPVIPFAYIKFTIIGVIGAVLLERGKRRKWKQMWTWITAGYVFWTALAFIYAIVLRSSFSNS